MGQDHSIVNDCERRGNPVTDESCRIEFDSSGNVFSFGKTERGDFEANPDIAGRGIFIAFMTLSMIVCGVGFILGIFRAITLRYALSLKNNADQFLRFMKYSKKLHEVVDDLIMSSADAQLLLVVAFGGAFYLTSQCSVSLYHYLVAFHMILVGQSTAILAFVLVRSTYTNFLSSVVRLGILAATLHGLHQTKDLDETAATRVQDVQARLPTNDQADSFLILPAYCILEETIDPFRGFTAGQREHLTNSGFQRNVYHQVRTILAVYVLTVFFTPVGPPFRKYVLPPRRDWDPTIPDDAEGQREKMTDTGYYMVCFLKGLAWICCVALIIWNWTTIVILRRWIDRSDWLDKDEGNPENDIQGIGQLAPLVAIGTVGFTVFNGIWSLVKKWRPFLVFNDEDISKSMSAAVGGYVEMQPMGAPSRTT